MYVQGKLHLRNLLADILNWDNLHISILIIICMLTSILITCYVTHLPHIVLSCTWNSEMYDKS